VTIQGDAVVGATLSAVVDATGDPAPDVTYQWAQCDQDQPNKCTNIAGARSATYVPVDADLGHPLIVRVTASNSAGEDGGKSAPTAAVVAAPTPPPDPTPPPPDPTPPPPPGPTPPPVPQPTPAPIVSVIPGTSTAEIAPSTADAVPFVATPVTAPPPAVTQVSGLRYLQPFPVVRIAGSSVTGGAYIELFRVAAPRNAQVLVNCRGKGCPARRLLRHPGRIRPLERFLPVGVGITIRVTRPGYIGKYVRLVIRSHAAPERRDACLMPGRTRPTRCAQ
jgi:hypothetical protein